MHDFDDALLTHGGFTLVDLIPGETVHSAVQAVTASVTRAGASENAPKTHAFSSACHL